MKVKTFHILLVLGLLFSTAFLPAAQQPPQPAHAETDSVVFFTADGMRQDLLFDYIQKGLVTVPENFPRTAGWADDHGMITQAPPNTGAGWYTLATGAWPGVHGSTNNTFHITGQPFANHGCLWPAYSGWNIGPSAERAGKKVAQIEWAGPGGVINDPTVDYRLLIRPGCRHNYTTK
jgi:hypothetical protein